jgi:hypothetical protein
VCEALIPAVYISQIKNAEIELLLDHFLGSGKVVRKKPLFFFSDHFFKLPGFSMLEGFS